MTRDELWAAYATKNPAFNGDGSVTMSARGLRKLFDQTWDNAFDTGFESGYSHKQPPACPPDISSVFGDIFGGKQK